MVVSASTISSTSWEVPLPQSRRDPQHLRGSQGQNKQGVHGQGGSNFDFRVFAQYGCHAQERKGLKLQRGNPWGERVPYTAIYSVDAFVALGGNADKSGYVSKTNLMEIVKREFELSLDLEAVIEGLQHDNLDYDVFCSIFEQDKERNEGRLASAASQRSLKSQGSARSLVIEERDFQKFLAQYENEDYW